MRGAAVDPTEWANKKKAAMERAKQLREERKNGTLTENDTFQPQVNPRRPSSNHNSKPADALDKLTNDYSNDIMEQPLPAQRNRQQAQQLPTGPLSPGSDALGKEVKRHGGSQYESVNKRQADAQYKSKFLQQYEDSHAHVYNQNHPNGQSSRAQQQQPQQPNPDEEFSNYLRSESGDGRKSSGPGWNSDTATGGGFDAPPARAKKPSRPAVQQATQARYQHQEDYGEPVRPPRASPRASSGGDMMSQYSAPSQGNDAVSQARPKLSLLKSKIRLSQGGSANNLPPPEPTNVNNSRRGNNGYYEQEQELQSHSTTVDVPTQRRQPPRSQQQQPPPYQNDSRGRSNSNGYYDNDQGDDEIMIAVPKNRTILKKANSQNDGNNNNNSYNPSFQNGQQSRVGRQQQQQNNYNDGYDENGYDQSVQRNPPNKPRFNPSYDEYPQQQQQQQQQQQAKPRFNPAYDEPPSQQSKPKFNPSYDEPPQQQAKPKFKPTYDEPPPQPSKPKFNPSYDENPYGQHGDDQEEEEDYGPVDESLPQHECPDCGRKFNDIAFSKHVKICKKVFMQKRKAFDSTKMRIGDNQELVKIFTKAQKEEKKQQILAQKQANKRAAVEEEPVGGSDKASKWKEQSKQFREAMKAAREYAKAKESGAPLPPPPVASAPDPTLTPCPHCGRRFNDKAAERHIPQCQNIKAKPSSLKRGSGVTSASGGAIAAQKKDARKKF